MKRAGTRKMYFILFGLIYAWSTYILRLMCVKISLVKFTNEFPLFWLLSFILPTALSFAILRPFSEAGWKMQLLQFDCKEIQRVTSSRRICSDVPTFTVCIIRNKCRESCSNRCIKKSIVSSLTSGDRNCHITLVKDLRMSSSTPTYPCELTCAIVFSSLESGEWDLVRRAWGLGILSKCEHTQNEKAFKVRTHSKWEHTQNENAFKVRTHSKWEHTQNENAFKMRTRLKWERIQNECTYSKWERPQNGNILKMTNQSAIKIQDNGQNTGNPSVNFTRLTLTHIKA